MIFVFLPISVIYFLIPPPTCQRDTMMKWKEHGNGSHTPGNVILLLA